MSMLIQVTGDSSIDSFSDIEFETEQEANTSQIMPARQTSQPSRLFSTFKN